MTTPSPFQIGAAVGSNISGAFKQQRDISAIDQILQQANSTGDESDVEDAMRQIISKVSPERQSAALNILKGKQQQIQAEKQAQQKSQNKTANPEVQKWAYKELEKKAPIQALTNSISELRKLNKLGATGPYSGRVPSGLANAESDAIRKAIDANAIQILNVHKSMFPRGLTQGEFKTLSEKLVSSKNTQEANDAILDAYDKLAKLQQSKIQAVEQATKEYGFDPMLPFIVSGIQKEFDEEEERENQNLYQKVVGNNKDKSGKKKMSIKEIFQ